MEDEDLLAALKMSLMTDDNDDGGNGDGNGNGNADGAGGDENDDDEAMLNDLLNDLPGLNADDVDDLLQDGNDDDKDKDKDKDKSGK